MAKRLCMVRPLPFTITGAFGGPTGYTNQANLLTADPKEVATLAADAVAILDIDLGAAKSVDTFYAGFLSANIGNVDIYYGTSTSTDTLLVSGVAHQSSELYDVVRHRPYVAAAPVTARYIRFNMTPAGAAGTLGVIGVGLAVQPTWGHEFGAGRPVEDTGVVDRLFSGGFGIYEGVRVGGYQWTFGDLSDAELAKLYALAKDRGTTRSILVVEDPDQTDGLNERVHWSLFDRLEPYERQVPGASRYAFKVRDWA